MLTKEEENFILYWNANREKQKKITNQWLIGLPAGLIFGLPILLNLFSGWNQRINFFQKGQLSVLIIAVIIIIAFFSIFTVRHKWDLREQHYIELLSKKNKEKNPNT